jgi:hypothetical protein
MTACLTKLLLALVLLSAVRPPTMHQRLVMFCERYERSIDCPAWVQGAMSTAYELAMDCHRAYPPPKRVPFEICLEEYGL